MASLSNTSDANLFAFGQHGSAVLAGPNTPFVPPPGYVVAALQILGEGVKFSKLYTEDENMFFNTLSSSHANANDTTSNTVYTDAEFVDMNGTATAKVGDFVYHSTVTSVKFIGKVKAVGVDENGDSDASMVQFDRKVSLAASSKLSFTQRNRGGGASAFVKTAEIPQGVTIFGRWNLVEISAGGMVIAYLAPASIDATKVEP